MFAGPNGSGKSTLKSVLPKELVGIYLNPDEIEDQIRRESFLDLANYGLAPASEEALSFFTESTFLKDAGMATQAQGISFTQGRISFANVKINSYLASVAADFLRQQLLKRSVSFTLETVMSHPGKVDLLKQAQERGFRTYLYFIATDDPAINISRVRSRVAQGGHPVPEDRIVSRYFRSLALLTEAIRFTHRAYVFDNSTDSLDHTWLAEITDGKVLELKSDRIPSWFRRSLLEKLARRST